MPQNIALAAFLFGAVLLLLALSSGGFKIFGAEMSSAGSRGARYIAGVAGAALLGVGLFLSTHRDGSDDRTKTPTVAAVERAPSDTPIPPSRPSASPTEPPVASPKVLPAGVLRKDQDSVQILDIVPPPQSYVHRGQPQTFHLKVAYSLQSADIAILSLSVAEFRDSEAGCSGRQGELSDATELEIMRGTHTVDVALDWSGDTGKATKGRVFGKGYLGVVPMFWHSESGHRTDRIRVFEGYDGVCIRFGD
jgi:hypothetical protein